jgi:hypothetical protein
MNRKNIALLIFLLSNFLFSIELIVKPYLQNATPTSIKIFWETDSSSETFLDWGTEISLSETTYGTSFTNYGSSKIHSVELHDLDPGTRYYYIAWITEGDFEIPSEMYSFITPPDPSLNSPFRIAAMSDMQKDNSNPNKFNEIVHDGLISYLSDNYSNNIEEELAMVLVTGDLVDNGNSHSQWVDDFFDPSSDLFSHVPLYPVFGNHEQDTDFFTNYFDMPDNGTLNYKEHWYYTDYSNLRLIGLDSNPDYRIQIQLDWLENVLADACIDENIDFVFTQLHHPYKSELWLPGETDYTGSVIELMENFTEQCGKPSIHFFGHTHGYSRGQSKDHEHLWVNVATAGGNIDYWGEYAQADYSEFTVTQDEWGFVMVDVEAGDNPKFALTRISRGNENIFRDNEIRDEIVIRLNNNLPERPVGYSVNVDQDPDFFTLSASEFIDTDGDSPIASEWTVFEDCDLNENPVFYEFINMENWYYNENTQESIELSEITAFGLSSNTSYCWSVRYRDSSLGWSEWSQYSTFETGQSQYSENLLFNPDAELGVEGWTVSEGYMESLPAFECDGIEPYAGEYYFIVGALCNTITYSESYQELNLYDYRDCIEEGLAYAEYSGFLSNWGGEDHPEMKLVFYDQNGNEINETTILDTYNSFWTFLSNTSQIPINAHSMKLILMGTRYAGDDNDSYFDNLSVRVWQSPACFDQLGDVNQDNQINVQDIILMISYILNNEYVFLADINEDNVINVQDIIELINIILNN